jgi:hypothetical protein
MEYNMKRKIMWVSQHLEIDTMSGRLQEHKELAATIDEDGEIHEGEIQNVMSTPFGIWKVDDTLNPYKQFKLWMGHTNFTINKDIVQLIKKTPGVEVLSIMTRYRFIIGVGELFDIRDVRVAIEQTLQCNQTDETLIEDPTLKEKIRELKDQLAKHDQWAIYVFPNGSIDFATDERGNRSFKEKLSLYKKAVDHSAGILIEKENE